MKYKVNFYPNIDSMSHVDSKYSSSEFDNINDALKFVDEISNYTLFLHDKGLMNDYSNLYEILQDNGNGKWEVLDEVDIDDLLDNDLMSEDYEYLDMKEIFQEAVKSIEDGKE